MVKKGVNLKKNQTSIHTKGKTTKTWWPSFYPLQKEDNAFDIKIKYTESKCTKNVTLILSCAKSSLS